MTQPGVVVVTGGSRGIGAAVCRRLAAAGHPVVVDYTAADEAADALVDELTGRGASAVAVRADVADERQVAALFAAARRVGPVTGLVNNAGVTGPYGRFEEVPVAALRRVLDVNVLGAMLCAQQAVRHLAYRHGGAGGSIVNVSSRAAALGSAGEWVHYAATKGALDTLTVGLAGELAADGIRVNGVAPGLIDTALHAAAGQPDRPARMAAGVPLGRPGTAEEVAEAVAWLLSDAASYTTGAIVPVGGGR